MSEQCAHPDAHPIQLHPDYERVRKVWDDALSICEAACRELDGDAAVMRRALEMARPAVIGRIEAYRPWAEKFAERVNPWQATLDAVDGALAARAGRPERHPGAGSEKLCPIPEKSCPEQMWTQPKNVNGWGSGMVGGRIIDIARHVLRDEDNLAYRREVFRVWCMDTRSNDECCINIEPFEPGNGPAIGDDIWWQGRNAFWTPAGNEAVGPGQGTAWDIVIDRIGYSYSPPGARL